MKVLKKYGLILAVILMRQSFVHTLFDYRQYKSLLTVFNGDDQNLSPVFGALAYSSDFLENMYNWAPERWPTYMLAHQLFTISEIDGQQYGALKLNTQKSNPARSLDGKLVGDIVVWLRNGQPEDVFETLVATMQEKYKAFLTSLRQSGNCISEDSVKECLETIAKSYNFDAKVTLMMLTAVLYLKPGIKKLEMIAYLQALHEGLGDIVFVEPLTEELKVEILSRTYMQTELIEKNTLESRMVAAISDDDEVIAPAVLMGIYECKDEREIEHCVEVALNDWFNIVLYSFDDNDFTLRVLPFDVRYSLSKEFRLFYETYTLEHVNSYEAKKAFRDMVSTVETVDEYFKDKDFEIESVSYYMFKVINQLLGLKADTWEDLCTLLSTKRHSIKKNELASPDELEFECDDNGNRMVFSLKIKNKKHVVLECKMRGNIKQRRYIHDYMGIGNRHSFFTYNIKNKNVGVRVLSEVISLETRLDIFFNALLYRNYCGEDTLLKRKLFESAIGFSEMMNLFNEQEVSDMISQSLLFLNDRDKDAFETHTIDLLMFAIEDVLSKDFNVKNYRLLFVDKYSKALPKYFFIMREIGMQPISELQEEAIEAIA